MKNADFLSLVEKSLTEMTYVEIPGDKFFDLEAEKFSQGNDFLGLVNKVKDIVLGKEFKDKRGTLVKLQTQEEALNFVNELKQDLILQKFLLKFFFEWLQQHTKR